MGKAARDEPGYRQASLLLCSSGLTDKHRCRRTSLFRLDHDLMVCHDLSFVRCSHCQFPNLDRKAEYVETYHSSLE